MVIHLETRGKSKYFNVVLYKVTHIETQGKSTYFSYPDYFTYLVSHVVIIAKGVRIIEVALCVLLVLHLLISLVKFQLNFRSLAISTCYI